MFNLSEKPTSKALIARMKAGVLLVLLSVSLAAQQPVPVQASSLSSIHHVFVIVMENHDWSAITPAAAPYIWNTLIPAGSHANNYHNIPTALGSLHPSEPNYMWLEGGTNAYPDFTFTGDADPGSANSTSSTQHLTTLLNASGKTWKSYQEDMPSGTCPITTSGLYAPKHNPVLFFQDVSGNPPSSSNPYCIAHHSVLTPAILQSDLNSNNVANYNFLTPNLNDDMHNGTVTQGDTYLSTIVPIILNSSVYKQDGALFITWDEGGEGGVVNGNNPIGMIVLSPFAKTNYANSIEYSHASTVKTVEEIFGLTPLVGHAADASTADLSDFFQGSTRLDSVGIYRSGTFYLRLHNNQGFADFTIGFNPAGNNFPVVGDWTGAGYDAVGVMDQNTAKFTLCTANATATCANSANQLAFTLGNQNDTPLSGRWQINATHAGAGVYRPSNGVLYLKNALTTGFADNAMVMGLPGDVGVAGDWTGKGFDSPGIYRPGVTGFFLSNQVTNGPVFADITATYGSAGDVPIAGDWTAQGHDGIGMFRPTNGFVYLKNILTSGFADNAFFYGQAGDQPVAGHWQVVYPPAPPQAQIIIAKTPIPAPNSGGGIVPGDNQIGG